MSNKIDKQIKRETKTRNFDKNYSYLKKNKGENSKKIAEKSKL